MIKKINTIILAHIIIFFILSIKSYAGNIKEYNFFSSLCRLKKNNLKLIAIRQYYIDNKEYYLTVNPENLVTSIHTHDELEIEQYKFEIIREKLSKTVYSKTLKESESNFQNAGIKYLTTLRHGVNLTIDLCPSKLPLDSTFFNELIEGLRMVEKPVPVAISITGKWIEQHEEDLKWLQTLEKDKKLKINWINHTYNHWYDKDVPLNENFLLKPDTDINYEVLETEIILLENGIIPSVFFRFPGLITNREVFNKITSLGLIPIGSDAWLAKNEWPKDGSIILIHANGNEPAGLAGFLKLLSQEKEKIMNKQWMLYDLHESIIESKKK